MSKPYFAYDNLVLDAKVTARLENSVYPARNLTKQYLWPGFRSGDQCLILNGIDEYAYVSDHADFDITGDFTIEALVQIDSFPSIGQWICTKRALVNTGYILKTDSVFGNKVEVVIGGSTDAVITTTLFSLQAAIWYLIKIVYNSSMTEVTIYINGAEVARANNNTQVDCTLSGTIPDMLGTNSNSFRIGSGFGAGNVDGLIAHLGIAPISDDHGSHLDPSVCIGYWNFDGDLSDSSGNNHHLTGVGIDSSNFASLPAVENQQIHFLFTSAQSPTFLFIDRRHNLSDGATVKLMRGDWFGTSAQEGATSTGTTGQPIVIALSSVPTADTQWWLAIDDPENPNGYIEIPYVYLGSKVDLRRGFLRGYRHSKRRHGSVLADSVGGYTAYTRSERLWEADFRLRALPGDIATVHSVAAVASLGRPFVFSDDGSVANTRLVYWPDALAPSYTHNVGDQNFVDLSLKEAGGGL